MYIPRTTRSERGSVLVVTLAVFGFFLLALVIFHFKAVRLMGGQQEQTTAAEAAALAAANDISKIVINDPNFGWISLSNQPATGTATIAGDGYPLPVRSINDILATIRLDMLIADSSNGSPLLKAQAVADYNNVLTAQANLSTAVQNAASGSAPAYDANGNSVDLVADATTAYNANLVRMTGKASQLVPNSLTVTVGDCLNASSNTPVPHDSKGNLSTSGASNSKGWYNAYVDCPYSGFDFVFAAVANTPAIVDTANYVATITSLPYQTPSVVKVDANQSYTDQTSPGTPSQYTMHCTACAEAGSNPNAWPNPGALVFSFSDGIISEAPQAFSLAPCVSGSGVIETYSTATPADVAGNTSQLATSGVASAPADAAIYNAIYDWLRSTGPRMVTDFFSMNSPALPNGTPCLIAYSFNSKSLAITVYNCEHVYPMASNKQLVGMSSPSFAAASTGQTYDLLIVDNVHNLGSANSGIHGGTPTYDTRLASNSTYPPGLPARVFASQLSGVNGFPAGAAYGMPAIGWDGPYGGWAYQVFHLALLANATPGSAGGDYTADYYAGPPTGSPPGIRPTYPKGGLAVDIGLHKVINAIPVQLKPG